MQRRLIHLGGGLAVAVAVAVALASGAQAQPTSPSMPADHKPAEHRSAAASGQPKPQALPVYRSPLNDYRPYRVDQPLRSWRDANDEAGRLGGHMGHLAPSAEGGER
ncbi:hydrolase [Thauera sp. SWB20]|uniref:hydrolase n=1 Tax=Thauera sp. SWB20 TaxID=1572758 RepID=UPI0005ADB420|nr:hydrolase [Thauera sp. SWB20]KIN89256.1 putative hydrolase [Thauera sp. SWB20]